MVASVAVLADIHGVLPVLGRAAWADDYLRAQASDADAIRAFGPRDGRPAG